MFLAETLHTVGGSIPHILANHGNVNAGFQQFCVKIGLIPVRIYRIVKSSSDFGQHVIVALRFQPYSSIVILFL